VNYAFDSSKGSSAQMAELSGPEMEATEGASAFGGGGLFAVVQATIDLLNSQK